MEDFNSKYSGEQVEALLDQVASGNAGGGGGGITAETDPVFLASPAASITDAKKEEWDNKVDKVSGKQLSTEDFTTALKTKLEGLNNYDDTELSNAIETLREDFDNIVSGDTTTAIKTFNEVIAFLEGIQDTQDLSSIIASIEQQIAAKQGAIADLETIRDGASKGATALQSIPEEYVTEDNLIWTKVEGEAGVRLKGTNGTATGNLAISAGDDKTASDGTPFASVASGDHAVAFGYGNTCSGRTTLAQGLYNIVTAKDSVAFGQRNTVNGDQAFAAGQQNEVSARIGVAIGYKNKATNTDSIAIGYQNTSSGSASVAMGDTCEASGTSSTAMGYKTKATGASSSTFGQNTQATNEGEVAMGLYNKSTTSTDAAEQTMFSFGIGTSDTNRANALEIKKNGDVYIGDKLLSSEGGTEVYIADFTMDALRQGMYNGSEVDCDMQGLIDAMTSNKIILVREYEEGAYKGVHVLNGYMEDLLYFSIVDSEGNVLYCEGTDYLNTQIYIDGQSLHMRSWDDKQDKLISGENIKTINGKSILGSGDISIEGGSAEVYITPFTVEDITSDHVNIELTQEQLDGMRTTASQNKLIAIPFRGTNYSGNKGFIVTNYDYKEDENGWSIDLTFTYSASEYIIGIGSYSGNIIHSSSIIKTYFLPKINEVSAEDGFVIIEDDLLLSDNVIWHVGGECTELNIYLEPSTLGKTIRFYTGSDCTLNFGYDVYWANGVIPTIEPYTHYELSLVGNSDYGYNAVLTPFKIV